MTSLSCLTSRTNVNVDYDSVTWSMSRYRKYLELLRSLRPDKVNSSERILDRDCQAPNRCFSLTFCDVNCALQISTPQILQFSHFFLICDGDNNKSSDYAFQNTENTKNSLLRDVKSRKLAKNSLRRVWASEGDSRMGVMMKSKSGLGLCVADFFWSGCVVAPLVVTYWRGTWDLLEDWVSQVLTKHKSWQLLISRCTQPLPMTRFSSEE